MGYREISLKLPTDFSEEQLRKIIEKELGIREFSYQIENKSLDARSKGNIHWLVRAGVMSDEIKGGEPSASPALNIPYRKRNEKVVVVGSGPAGFFSAFVLQKAGF
ncbi:MAG: FAD-dependent oxidoreductase, partial [Nitrospirota bacterium]|nr:FAD-dependent oxidoreductase [Nitrospirota bacterium]